MKLGNLCSCLKLALLGEIDYRVELGGSCVQLWNLWKEGVAFDLGALLDAKRKERKDHESIRIKFLPEGSPEWFLVALEKSRVLDQRSISSVLLNEEDRKFLLRYTARLGMLEETTDLVSVLDCAKRDDVVCVAERLLKSPHTTIVEMGVVLCNTMSTSLVQTLLYWLYSSTRPQISGLFSMLRRLKYFEEADEEVWAWVVINLLARSKDVYLSELLCDERLQRVLHDGGLFNRLPPGQWDGHKNAVNGLASKIKLVTETLYGLLRSLRTLRVFVSKARIDRRAALISHLFKHTAFSTRHVPEEVEGRVLEINVLLLEESASILNTLDGNEAGYVVGRCVDDFKTPFLRSLLGKIAPYKKPEFFKRCITRMLEKYGKHSEHAWATRRYVEPLFFLLLEGEEFKRLVGQSDGLFEFLGFERCKKSDADGTRRSKVVLEYWERRIMPENWASKHCPCCWAEPVAC